MFPLEIEYPGFGEGEVQCKVNGGKQKACAAEYAEGTKLALVPIAKEGSEFVGFEFGSGSAEGCAELALTCEFTIEEESYVEAVFELKHHTLAVNVSGEGTVWCEFEFSSEPCDSEFKYEFGTEIVLEAEAEPGWEFAGFKNGVGSTDECVGLGPCTVFLEADSTLEATFVPKMHALTIAKAGTGQGTVTCNGTTCAPSYAEGTVVTLKATPAQGSTFAGWSGKECSGTGSCVVAIEEADVAVTATFEASPAPPPPPPPAGKASAAATAKVKAGKALVKLSCSGGPCNGTLKLTAKVTQGSKRKSVMIGKGPFGLAAGASKTLKVKLSAAAIRELKKAGTLKAKASGTSFVPRSIKLKANS